MLEIEKGKIEKEKRIKDKINSIFESYKETLEKKGRNQNEILE